MQEKMAGAIQILASAIIIEMITRTYMIQVTLLMCYLHTGRTVKPSYTPAPNE